MELNILEATSDHVRAGYDCPCGCHPSVEFGRGADVAREGCCCGNEFAVGPHAGMALAPRTGYRAESRSFTPPWGEALEAAWLIGPSVHGPSGEVQDESAREAPRDADNQIVDRVCGMTVDAEAARAGGLHSLYAGAEYFFCGRGCKLDFDEDPQHYLDAGYTPAM